MKIWNLPPEYLDNYHLLEDYRNTVELFNEGSVEPDYELFLFLKAKLSEDEISSRQLDDEVDEFLPDDDLPEASQYYTPTIEQVRKDVNAIMGVWETMIDEPYIDGLEEKVERLSLTTYDELYNDLIGELEEQRERWLL